MDMIFVRPSEGGRIRQPERGYAVMPETGAYVPNDGHYQKLLATGDVVKVQAPAQNAPAAAAPSADPQPAADSDPAPSAELSEEITPSTRKPRGR